MLTTEDSIRNFLREKKLPMEWASDLLASASKRKDDFVSIVSREVVKFLQHLDIQDEISKFMRTHNMKIKAEITFEPISKERKERNAED